MLLAICSLAEVLWGNVRASVCVCVFTCLLVCKTVWQQRRTGECKPRWKLQVFIVSWFSDKLILALLWVTAHFRAFPNLHMTPLILLYANRPLFHPHLLCVCQCSRSIHHILCVFVYIMCSVKSQLPWHACMCFHVCVYVQIFRYPIQKHKTQK